MANDTDQMRSDLAKQVADLKAEVARISRAFTDRTSSVIDKADDTYEEVRRGARKVVDQARDNARGVVDLARENPATTATALSAAGLLGVALGILAYSLFSGAGRAR